jgi:choline dehydrogenase-like flavoprotein
VSVGRIWDYVVVGAGSAGLALAAGLAKNAERGILLLDLDKAASEPAAAVRPHVLEFDDWAATGAHEWTPEQVLPHFKSIETDEDYGSLRYHGTEGILRLKRSPENRWSVLDCGFREAAVEKGHPWAPDHNAPGALGVSPLAWTANRIGPAGASDSLRNLLDAANNVDIQCVDAVDRVLWNGNQAVGLRVRSGPVWQEIGAEEIILCAGGTRSPAILQRSGIGPADTLRSIDIAVLSDLPVGRGLQVHAQLRMMGGSTAPLATDGFQGGMLARWNTGQDGTSSGDLMAWTVNGAGTQANGLAGALAQVFSRGSVLVAGPDPSDDPIIDARMLTDPLDAYRFRLLYRHLSDLAARPGLAPHFAAARDRSGQPWSSNRTDVEVEEWLRTVVEPMGDWGAGCRMGEAEDPAAVVDGTGKVFGVIGVRIADSSISPKLVRAAPMLTDAVIGSRVAQLIIENRFA